MHKPIKQIILPVSFLKEGKQIVAYSPALDLSTCGRDLKEAKEMFIEAVEIFFEELIEKGTLDEVLTSLGWTKKDDEIVPPMLIAQESMRVPLHR